MPLFSVGTLFSVSPWLHILGTPKVIIGLKSVNYIMQKVITHFRNTSEGYKFIYNVLIESLKFVLILFDSKMGLITNLFVSSWHMCLRLQRLTM